MENTAQPVTYESYRLIYKKQNISFTKLGEEECEICEIHKQHVCKTKGKMIEPENVLNKNIPANEQDHERELEDRTGEDGYSICFDHNDHLQKAKISRKMYQLDVDRNEDGNQKYCSVDMQKIVMLPHLSGLKTAVFTRRILVINETIAPLGGKENGGKLIGFLWHETVQCRRNDEDVANVIISFLSTIPFRILLYSILLESITYIVYYLNQLLI